MNRKKPNEPTPPKLREFREDIFGSVEIEKGKVYCKDYKRKWWKFWIKEK